jgi:hypothetical protein
MYYQILPFLRTQPIILMNKEAELLAACQEGDAGAVRRLVLHSEVNVNCIYEVAIKCQDASSNYE